MPQSRIERCRSPHFTAFARTLLLAWAVLVVPFAWSAHAETSRMSGRVIDSDSQKPVANADVELANTSGGQGFHRARTNARGEFAIEGISSDRYYTLTVGAVGFADFVIGGWQIPAAQRAAELVVPLDRAGVLVVRALRTDGKTPVANARVQLQSERGSTWWEGYRPPPAPRYTDNGGSVRFEGLTAGFWTAVVEGDGLRTAEARRIAVRRGETTQAPVKLGKPGSLSGLVRLADGTGVPGVTITARGPSEQVATSGTDGTFALSDLAAGKIRIETSHEGFEPFTVREPVVVREGEAREIAAITLKPKPAEFAFVLEREAFLPDVVPKLGLRSFRTGPIDLALYVIPTSVILNPAGDFRRYAFTNDSTGLVSPERWQHAPAAGPEWSWREEELSLPHALPPGAYLLKGRAGAIERRVIFFVTDMGLLVKRSATQVWVSAAALKGGKPVPGASVYVIQKPVPPAGEGQGWSTAIAEPRRDAVRTDADGIASITDTGKGARLRIVAVSETQGLAVVDAPIAPAAERGGDQSYLYTDRPIYRPGHALHWKLFARKATAAGGWALPDATAATVVLEAPDGTTLGGDATPLSARGSSDGTITLPAEAALGDWTLRASIGGSTTTATVAVQDYRKPEFQVEVTPDRAVYVNGDEVRFRIAASYFFGAPVFGATVRYNLFEARIDAAGDDPDSEFSEGGARGYGRVLKTGETRTDLDGRAEVSLVPERVPYDRRLTLEVEVVDPSQRVVNARGEAIMGRGLFTLAVHPVTAVVAIGRPMSIEVTARDHADRPVVAAVTVEIDQEAWNPLERRYTRSTRPLASQVVTTDSLGRGRVTLTPSPARGGRLILRARAEDAKGNRITAESSAWAHDPSVTSYAYRYPALEAFADKARYRTGDTARVLVNTDVRNATVLVTVEGRDLFDRRVVRLIGNSALVPIPIRAEWAPNVFVAIHVRRGMEVHSRTIELPVDAMRHDLKIELTPDRERARPGDSTTVRVRTTDGNGRPVAAEVSLGVVDEAIYSIRADDTPDPHSVFYGRRPNWVTTVVSFPVLYYGGVSKGDRDEVRRNFRDVAHWEPAILTSAAGTASVGFRYPDNLTTWRMTSRGATLDTRVGKAVVKTLVTKDVVSRLAGPRFFVAGDRASLVSVVTNRSEGPLTGVEESIEVTGAVLEGPTTAKTQIAKQGESRNEWQVRIPEPARDAESKDAVFTFRARAKADSDALEVRVPVRARAVPLLSHGAGVAPGASSTLNVSLPGDLVRAGSRVTIDIAPSPAAVALTAVQELLDYPYGCTEQTANAILPAAAMASALRKASVTAPGFENPSARIAAHLQRLAALHKPDGGWGWWPEGDMDPYLTVLAIDAIARATLAGIAPEGTDGAIDPAVYVLPRVFAEVRTLDGEAYVIAHLASMTKLKNAKDRFPGVRERLDEMALAVRSAPDQLGNAGLALATRAHAELGMTAEAAILADKLIARGVKSGGLHWEADREAYDWWGDDISNTGLALDALLAVRPDDRRATEIVQWLVRHRTGPWWRSTRVSAPVAAALANFAGAHASEMKAQGQVRAEWNGARVIDATIGAAEIFGRPLRATVDGARLRAGDNRLVITTDGGITAYWSWNARALVPSPGPVQKPGVLAVTREYLRAERTTDRRGRPRWLTTPLTPTDAVRVGEAVLVRLTLRATRTLRHLMLEDPRLAGFEIDQLLPDGAEWPYGTHAEGRDDRAVFFLENLAEGETTVEYLIRPEIGGRFIALPATASGMYDPDLLTRSGEEQLTVKGR